MKLVSCSNCHAQYDVTNVGAESFTCHCGTEVENRGLDALEHLVHRCAACGALLEGDAEQCAYCAAAVVRDANRLSLICPECYARNPDDCRFCTACGIAFQPQALPQDLKEVPCPCCGALMPAHQIGGIAVNECSGCHGLWLPGQELDALVQRALAARERRGPLDLALQEARPQHAPRPNPAAQPVTYRKCPVCEAFMLRRNYRQRSGVIIDVCAEHGTWLDADELEQIGAFILGGGLARADVQAAERERQQMRSAREEHIRFAIAQTLGRSDDPRTPHAGAPPLGTMLDWLRHLLS